MCKIIFTDENGKYEKINNMPPKAEYIKSDFLKDIGETPVAISAGGFCSFDGAEKIKKSLIENKINGSFILVNPDFGENGKLYDYADNKLIKKLKEVCLFANMVFLNFTEACVFANLTHKETCSRDDAEKLIFRLNSFGMANKLVITEFPLEETEKSVVISEFGECEILDIHSVEKQKALLSAYTLQEILNGKKIKDAVVEGWNIIK